MKKNVKFTETGILPSQLNFGTTAKNFSDNETTCPQDNLMYTLTESDLVQENIIIISDTIIEEE